VEKARYNDEDRSISRIVGMGGVCVGVDAQRWR